MNKNMMWEPVLLKYVRVTDAYCANAFSKERDYLLSLSVDRLLAGFYENAGLKTSYVRYEGWESMLIGGHTLGHYLSALSLAYASSGDEALAAHIKRILSGLSECQAFLGSGLIWGAAPVKGGIEAQFDNVESGKTNIKREAWVPWYTLHKLLAGLVEAAQLFGCIATEALHIARRLGDWVVARVSRWDRKMRERVLAVEYGGMNDCLYDLYALTGDERYAIAAHVFDEDALFAGMLHAKEHFLDGKHANTTIPKFLGGLKRYLVLHGKTIGGARVDATFYLQAAQKFFDAVILHHTYVTGGNSEWEHFGKDDILNAERTNCNCETCNVYNMLKLARGLYSVTGDEKYLDYYDRAFTNAILPSQNPETGMTTYFQPMAGGFFKVFSRPYDKFWCCTGSGMENFSKLGEGIFYVCGEKVVIARYLSSKLCCGDIALTVSADFPEKDSAVIRVEGTREFTLCLRIPDWCSHAVLTKNGEKIDHSGRIAQIRVKHGDIVELRLEFGVTLHGLPDSDDVFAFQYGNVVLAALLGTENMRETETGVDVNIPARQIMPTEKLYFRDVNAVLADPAAFLVRDGEKFTLRGADIPLTFGMYYKLYRERYALYFHLCDGERGAEEFKSEALDSVQPGYGQYETDALHDMQEQNTVSVTSSGTYRYARKGGYFCYDMSVDPAAEKNILEITLCRDDNGKTLTITAEGMEIFSERLLYTMGEKFYQRKIMLPSEVMERARVKEINGQRETVVNFRFAGFAGRVSAKLCETIKTYTE